jgi:aspartate-semialdehyde dehydrogenase
MEELDVEVGRVFLLSEGDSDATVAFRGDDIPVLDLAGYDWKQADVAILASRAGSAQRLAEELAHAGRPVLGVGLVEGVGVSPLLQLHSGPAIAVSRVAALLAGKAGLAALHASLSLPVSHLGKAAIEELSEQARALFALESIEAEVLPPRIAFNLIPQVADTREGASSRFERAVEVSVRSLLSRQDLPVSALACWVPVFYGYAAVLHLVTETALDLGSLRTLLARPDGITVMDEPLPGGVPTPATDALDSEDVFVGRVRVNETDARHCSLWLVFDGLRLEAAQIVAGLENLIEKNQKSVLT